MTQYHYTRDKASTFDLFGQIKGYAYNSNDDFPRAGISYTEVEGEAKLTTCITSDIVFYILSGEGEFVVDGRRFHVKETDAILVPKNIEFGYFGKMSFIEFMAPAFTEDCAIFTDKSPRDL